MPDFTKRLQARRRESGAAGLEKALQQARCIVASGATDDLGAVMAGGLIEKARPVKDRSAFRILRRKYQACDARETDGAHAHRTRLERDVKRRAHETLIAETGGTLSQHEHLGMGSGIAHLDDPVAAFGQQTTVGINENGADGHLATGSSCQGLVEGHGHEFVVGHAVAHSVPLRTSWSCKADRALNCTAMTGFDPRAADVAASVSEGERIAKVIARAGICSRRDAEKLVAERRVTLDGETVSTPATRVMSGQVVAVDGKPLAEPEQAKLWRYHKPAGLVTTHRDPEGRPTVFANLPKNLPRVVSVGRLDVNSEGLLLLTNDGALARRLELPSAGWTRKYRVRLFGKVSQTDLDALAQGMTIDRVKYEPVIADLERVKGMYAWAAVSLKEGKNREVKRLMEHLGLKVARLIRIQFGPFHLGQLEPGQVEEIPPKVWRSHLGMDSKNNPKKDG